MSEERQLLVGIDIGEDVTQISCFDRKLYEAVPIGRGLENEREYEIPTVLAVQLEQYHWVWGTEALEADESYIQVENFFQETINGKEALIVGEYSIALKEVWKHFMAKCLSLLHEYYPDQKICKLVVTTKDNLKTNKKLIREACEEFGIKEDRLIFQCHKQSYMYYAVSQAKELWMNSVGMFEYDSNGLTYSQISIDRRTNPYIVGVRQKDLSDVMTYEMVNNPEEVNIGYAFTTAANTVLHKQMVTTLYVTGKGFDKEWAADALKELCNGRRVFRGQNLFTKGACYAAREFAGEGKLDDFIFLDEDMISCDVSIKVYRDAQTQEVILAKAGTLWSEVDASIDVIPDAEEEIQIITKDILKRETKAHMLSLSGFPERGNKMTRFTIRIRFADKNKCIVTLKDNGFGQYFPSSNRIWETYISI